MKNPGNVVLRLSDTLEMSFYDYRTPWKCRFTIIGHLGNEKTSRKRNKQMIDFKKDERT